ncbi:unnamed protein product [Prorocentrum cordatum]|uniref:Uncharacterized protein n=1 Tax=Prorocentrum cordatum TaxID=2364126 RepID=A0ABN9TPS9_9DINO|nr:unnamed protein product [Polarella glacialis]
MVSTAQLIGKRRLHWSIGKIAQFYKIRKFSVSVALRSTEPPASRREQLPAARLREFGKFVQLRLLVAVYQAGLERQQVEKRLWASRADPFLGFILAPGHHCEHVVRHLDACSRALLVGLDRLLRQGWCAMLCLIICARVLLISSAAVPAFIDAYVADPVGSVTRRARFVRMAPGAPSYKPYGKHVLNEKLKRKQRAGFRAVAKLLRERRVLPPSVREMRSTLGLADGDRCSFAIMQVAMDAAMRNKSWQANSAHFQRVGGGCQCEEFWGRSLDHRDLCDIAAWIRNQTWLHYWCDVLSFTQRGWWFLVEHSLCAFRKYKRARGSRALIASRTALNTALLHYHDATNEKHYRDAVAARSRLLEARGAGQG